LSKQAAPKRHNFSVLAFSSGRPVRGLLLACVLAGCGTAQKAQRAADELIGADRFERATFADLPGWDKARPLPALEAFVRSCHAIPRNRDRWLGACTAALSIRNPTHELAKTFFERWLVPWKVKTNDGKPGHFTGYYEAEMNGSRKRTRKYRYPVFGVPKRGPRRISRNVIDRCVDDWPLPPRKGKKRRRVRKKEPLAIFMRWGRSRIDACALIKRWPVLVWVDSRIDLFITEIQGSARVKFEDGSFTRVGYGAQNGRRYRAIGKVLIDQDEIKPEDMSMQAIRKWLIDNPKNALRIMHTNPSYIFFKDRDKDRDNPGPRGAMGIPLTPYGSIAVDRRYIPLGTPLWIDTTWPLEIEKQRRKKLEEARRKNGMKKWRIRAPVVERPLRMLMVAQDVGGAIRGAVRGDTYWGTGPDAFNYAGHMNQKGYWWALFPKGYVPGS